MSNKTEEATPKRLRRAQEEGDSGASSFAAQAVAFLVVVTLLPAAAQATAAWGALALREALARVFASGPAPVDGRARDLVVAALAPGPLAWAVASLAGPVLLAAAVAGGAASLVQAGGVVATRRLALKPERLDPIAGMKQLFSTTRLFSVARALAGGGVVAWLAWRALRGHAGDLAHLAGAGPLDVARAGGTIAVRVARDAALAGLAIGAIDSLVVRRAWRRRLRMTKEEVRREHKESEGDPQTKAARERAHREVLAEATIANVRTAQVVVVNPTHVACALRYDEEGGDEAPVLVAAGEGDLAERIVRAARDYGVPVVRDVPLARALRELEVGDVIPEALYEAVAEILRAAWDEVEG